MTDTIEKTNASKKETHVIGRHLTKRAQPKAWDLVKLCGGKINIALSAAVIGFHKLPDDKQKEAILESQDEIGPKKRKKIINQTGAEK